MNLSTRGKPTTIYSNSHGLSAISAAHGSMSVAVAPVEPDALELSSLSARTDHATSSVEKHTLQEQSVKELWYAANFSTRLGHSVVF